MSSQENPAAAVMDLNSDVGEGFGSWTIADDGSLLKLVTSANVACGFHAGDPRIMRETCETAVANDVRIGAHVGYRDLAGFGRRYLAVDPADLVDDVLYQLGALDGMARVAGGKLAYVKPHGALYNRAVSDAGQAGAIVEAIRRFNPELTLLALSGSKMLELAEEAGLRTAVEAFADRAYTPEGTLVPRGQAGAVVHDVAEVARRCVRMATAREVVAIDGTVLPVHADSVCIHSDTPGSVELAGAVRTALTEAGVTLRSFA